MFAVAMTQSFSGSIANMLCISGFVSDVIFSWCILPIPNSQNYYMGSDHILLNNKDWQLYIMGCTSGV